MATSAERSLILKLKEDRQGSALVEAARDLEKLAKGADGAGDSFKGMASDGEKLNAQIEESTKRVKDLQSQIARTGDKSLIGDLKSEQRFLTDLQKISKEMKAVEEAAKQVSLEPPVVHAKSLNAELARTRALVENLKGQVAADVSFLPDLKREKSKLKELEGLAGDAASAGVKIGGSVVGGIGSAFDGLGPYVKPILIGAVVEAVVLALPLVGAAISGAVTGVAGIGGIAGGLFAASRDPALKAAAAGVGASISEEFFGGGKAFVQPAIQSLHVLEDAFHDLNLGDSFARIAPHVTTLAAGVGDFVKNIMPGFNAALDRSGPFIGVIADGLGGLGTALGDFMDEASSSEGAVQGLATFFGILQSTVIATGAAINVLSDIYGAFVHLEAVGFGLLADVIGGVFPEVQLMADGYKKLDEMGGRVAPTIDAASRGVAGFGKAADAAGDATLRLKDAWNELNGAQMTLDEAMLRATEGAKRIKDTFAEGGKSIVGHSQAVLENRQALYENAQQAQAAAAKYLSMTGDVDGAQKILDEFRKTAEKSAGATGGQAKAIHDLTVELYKLPKITPVDVIVTTTYLTVGGSPTQANRNIRNIDKLTGDARADGGPVIAGMPYMINERGKETVTFPAGGTVHAANLTPAMSSGGNTVNYYVTVNAPPLSNPVEVGATVVAAVKQYEMANGTGWRA